jgi:hypothetical protein
MRKLNLLLVIVTMFLAPTLARAQQTTGIVVSDSLVEVRLADGSTLFGKIVAVTESEVSLRTTAGAQVTVPRAQIRSVRIVRGTAQHNGEVWPEDTNTSRLFLTPTGRSLPAGRAQFGVLELFFPFISYGIDDRFTLTAGTPIIPELIGEIYYVAPKLEIVRTPTAHVSASVLGFFGGSEGEFGSAGVLYGVGTFGTPDKSVTVGGGFPFYAGNGENELASRPVIILGGEYRSSRRIKFMTETLLFSYRDCQLDSNYNCHDVTKWQALIGGGLRFIGERISADAGLGVAAGQDGGCCLPLVNFAYTFGKR